MNSRIHLLTLLLVTVVLVMGVLVFLSLQISYEQQNSSAYPCCWLPLF
ncbi:MAG: hypothetical protein ABW148_06865 [Sedimenticola sp.]